MSLVCWLVWFEERNDPPDLPDVRDGRLVDVLMKRLVMYWMALGPKCLNMTGVIASGPIVFELLGLLDGFFGLVASNNELLVRGLDPVQVAEEPSVRLGGLGPRCTAG